MSKEEEEEEEVAGMPVVEENAVVRDTLGASVARAVGL